MSDRRKAEFRRLVADDGGYIGEIDPETLEYKRTERGCVRRVNLTKYLDPRYANDEGTNDD